MEITKRDILFTVIITILCAGFIVCFKNFSVKINKDFKGYSENFTKVTKFKDAKIKKLSHQLVEKDKEIQYLRNTLAETRNDLEGLTKKLLPPSPVAAPASVPAALNVTK